MDPSTKHDPLLVQTIDQVATSRPAVIGALRVARHITLRGACGGK